MGQGLGIGKGRGLGTCEERAEACQPRLQEADERMVDPLERRLHLARAQQLARVAHLEVGLGLRLRLRLGLDLRLRLGLGLASVAHRVAAADVSHGAHLPWDGV